MLRGMASPKTWREVQDGLRRLGAKVDRCNGSHEVWLFPDGEVFLVVRNHLADSVPRFVRLKFRKLHQRRTAVPLSTKASSKEGAAHKEQAMSKQGSGGGNGGKGNGGNGGKGGGAPSTTGRPSGGGRDNSPPSK